MPSKTQLIAEVNCPYCNKQIQIYKDTEIIAPAVAAEKEETYRATKSNQTKLTANI